MAFPYIKIEPPDYLNNYSINSLSCEEFGAMMRLFFLMWQADMMLHNDDIYIARQLNMDSVRWAEIKSKLDRLHIIAFDDSGNIINSGIKTSFIAAQKFSEQQKTKRLNKKKKPVTK